MRILASALVLAALGGVSLGPAEGVGAQEDPFHDCSALLHDGRFDEADEVLAGAGRRGEPDGAFFEAFVVYWRLLYDHENPSLRAELEQRLMRAITLAEDSLRSRPQDPRGSLFAGSSHLLLAELRASQKKVFAAASEAKKAKRHLESALLLDRVAADSAFGLGAYNYMADRAPTFVKGLRTLLFLPGGDRSAGLRQLEQAASESRYFRLEARILLSTIYSSKHERLFAEAERQARLALEAAPGRVAALDAAARLALLLGRPERAGSLLDAAVARAASAPRTDSSVLAAIEYQRARAEVAALRPDLAGRRLRQLLSTPRLSRDLARDAGKLADLCATLLATPLPPARKASEATNSGGPEADGRLGSAWDQAVPSLEQLGKPGDHRAALDRLAKLAGASPTDPVLTLIAGRALLRARLAEEALPLLLRAARSDAMPRGLQGLSKLLAGQASDLCGRRPLALELYRSAIESPSFIGRDAAQLGLRSPFREED